MSVTNHERPGVYSRYDASTVVKGRGGGGCVGLAALCGTGTAGTLYTFNRYEEAVTAFGGEETLTELVRLLFLNGAAQVKAVPVAEEAGYVGYSFAFWEGYDGHSTGVQVTGGGGEPETGPAAGTAGERRHTVRRGETLWGIARDYSLSLTELIALNPQIKNPNLILAGEEVRLA